MNELTQNELRERLGNIDQIRDILFGPQLRESNNRLEQVEKSLSGLQQEIRERTDELKQVLSTEFQASVDNLEKKIKSIVLKDEQEKFDIQQKIELLTKRISNSAEELKSDVFKQLQIEVNTLDSKIKSLTQKDDEEKVDLRQQIDRVNKKLSSNVESLDQTIETQTNALRDDLLSSREKLQGDILSLRNQVFTELERRFSLLLNSKVARDDLAEFLFELGLRLKGTEFVPKLKEAADSENPSSSYIVPEFTGN
jgi:hypothetical protein